VETACKALAYKGGETYSTPVYHHHAMEPHATVAEWQGSKLLIYDATQSVSGTKGLMVGMLGVKPENVRVISLYIGGGFGSKGFSWPNTVLAVWLLTWLNARLNWWLIVSKCSVQTAGVRKPSKKLDLATNNARQAYRP
jgi:CO/xanthine dehydrogenase Mo-binding subunit